MTESYKEFSFERGWSKLPKSKTALVRNRIMEVFGFKVKSSFYSRLHGEVEPKISEVKEIERIFSEYGITDIWGGSD